MAEQVEPVKDKQMVTAEGESVLARIHGLVIRRAVPIEDKRGEIVEMYRPAWGVHPDPLVYAYQISLRVGAIKGWVCHRRQEDRIFMSTGVVRWGLYDDRSDSPTHKMLNTFTFSERSRALMVIPRGVFHAVQNIGEVEAFFINMPSRAYDHADPDKYRLPLKNSLIPFAFDDGPGW